jgi:hypothetical protein
MAQGRTRESQALAAPVCGREGDRGSGEHGLVPLL